MSKWVLPVPESPIRQSGCPAFTQPQPTSWWTVAAGTFGLAAKSNSSTRFVAREPCGVHPSGRLPGVAVVALGHDQLGEERQVGQLFPLRGGRDLGEP